MRHARTNVLSGSLRHMQPAPMPIAALWAMQRAAMRRLERSWWPDEARSATELRVCGVGSLQLAGGWLVAPRRSYIHCSRVVLITLGPWVGSLTENSLISNANYAYSTVTRATKAKANPISVLTGIDGRLQVHAYAPATLTWHQ